jgi:hypothetical protein
MAASQQKETTMKISEIMTVDVETAAPDDTLQTAAQLMAVRNRHSAGLRRHAPGWDDH